MIIQFVVHLVLSSLTKNLKQEDEKENSTRFTN